MKHYSAKKLALAGMFCALAVVGSVFSFPVFGSKKREEGKRYRDFS